jgi:hypothetical protein
MPENDFREVAKSLVQLHLVDLYARFAEERTLVIDVMCRRCGMSEDDAGNLVAEALTEIAEKIAVGQDRAQKMFGWK